MKVKHVSHGAFAYESCIDIGTTIKSILQSRELVLLDQTENSIKKISKFSKKEKDELNIDPEKLKDLKDLTSVHKNFIYRLSNSKITHIVSWIKYIAKLSKLF